MLCFGEAASGNGSGGGLWNESSGPGISVSCVVGCYALPALCLFGTASSLLQSPPMDWLTWQVSR